MYQHLPLLRLAELIARNSDEKALQELHNNRKVFHYSIDRQPLRLAEFTDRLRQSNHARQWCNGESEILERAYDLTISKFSNLPNLNKNCPGVKLEGSDCRYYYEAFVKQAAKTTDSDFRYRDDDKERQMAKLLQNLIVRHFRLSCQECSRSGRELTTRYLWQVNGHSMEILLSVDIEGRQRGKWLTDHILDVDPTQPGERDRVQDIVDDLTRKRNILSLEDIEENAIVRNSPCSGPQIEQEITVKGLADVVAEEKAENIEIQRDAIQQLGKEKLRQLVRQVFDCLARGQYEVVKIAENFGINKTTFSRFAGSNWLTQSGKSHDYPIPDLWFNTAQTLAGHPMFVRVANNTGILKHVEKVLESNNAPKKKWSLK